MAAVPPGLIASLDIANAANWSIGVQWRFVLVLRPSLTAVGALVEFSCCKRAGGAREPNAQVGGAVWNNATLFGSLLSSTEKVDVNKLTGPVMFVQFTR